MVLNPVYFAAGEIGVSLVIPNKPLSTTPEFMLNELTLGGSQRASAWGPVAGGTNHVIRGWELAAPSPTSREASGASPAANEVIGHACILEPP